MKLLTITDFDTKQYTYNNLYNAQENQDYFSWMPTHSLDVKVTPSHIKIATTENIEEAKFTYKRRVLIKEMPIQKK